MNRLNKSETAVFKFQVVCFQRISFQIICRLKIFHFCPPMRFGRLKMSKIILYTEIINISYLYSRHLCRGLYSFRLSVRPFVRSYVRSFVRLFVCSFVRTSVPFVELLQSFTFKQLEWSISHQPLIRKHSYLDHRYPGGSAFIP